MSWPRGVSGDRGAGALTAWLPQGPALALAWSPDLVESDLESGLGLKPAFMRRRAFRLVLGPQVSFKGMFH